MGERSRAFNEVKALLGDLDRSIDEARQRRLDRRGEPQRAPEENRTDPPQPDREPDADRAGRNGADQHPGPDGTTAKRPGSSPYGRARPLRRSPPDAANGSGSSVAWRKP